MVTWIKAPGIAIACGVLFAGLSRAGYTPPAPIPEIAQEISFQAMLTDMALPSISPDPKNSPALLSYQGSFSQGVLGSNCSRVEGDKRSAGGRGHGRDWCPL
jgi:hypothetical protein